MCFCGIVNLQVIYQIDFLHEFLITHHASILSIITVNFCMHTQTTSVLHPKFEMKKKYEILARKTIFLEKQFSSKNNQLEIGSSGL